MDGEGKISLARWRVKAKQRAGRKHCIAPVYCYEGGLLNSEDSGINFFLFVSFLLTGKGVISTKTFYEQATWTLDIPYGLLPCFETNFSIVKVFEPGSCVCRMSC